MGQNLKYLNEKYSMDISIEEIIKRHKEGKHPNKDFEENKDFVFDLMSIKDLYIKGEITRSKCLELFAGYTAKMISEGYERGLYEASQDPTVISQLFKHRPGKR